MHCMNNIKNQDVCSRKIESPNIDIHEHRDSTVAAVSVFQYRVCYKRPSEVWSPVIEWPQ
jgi:hypothetical protein